MVDQVALGYVCKVMLTSRRFHIYRDVQFRRIRHENADLIALRVISNEVCKLSLLGRMTEHIF